MDFLTVDWIAANQLWFGILLAGATIGVFLIPLRGMKGALVLAVLLCVFSAWYRHGLAFAAAWCAFLAWIRIEKGTSKD